MGGVVKPSPGRTEVHSRRTPSGSAPDCLVRRAKARREEAWGARNPVTHRRLRVLASCGRCGTGPRPRPAADPERGRSRAIAPPDADEEAEPGVRANPRDWVARFFQTRSPRVAQLKRWAER